MNVRISKHLDLIAALVFQEDFLVNQYSININMVTATDDHRQQNIAYDRIKFWLSNMMSHSILIKKDNKLLDAFKSTKARLITLPEEPVDQIIGIMLYSKLNSIVEGRMVITDLDIMSVQGDHTVYYHSEDETLGAFANDNWWNDPSPVFNDLKDTGKIVSLKQHIDWASQGLQWDDHQQENNTVVFADFGKDETK